MSVGSQSNGSAGEGAEFSLDNPGSTTTGEVLCLRNDIAVTLVNDRSINRGGGIESS
jgi:hypothetical protein